jgi:hypothetical protein
MLLHVSGSPDAALSYLDKHHRAVREADAPDVAYEAARVTAMASAALHLGGEADRQARLALAIARPKAGTHGSGRRWPSSVSMTPGITPTPPPSRRPLPRWPIPSLSVSTANG